MDYSIHVSVYWTFLQNKALSGAVILWDVITETRPLAVVFLKMALFLLLALKKLLQYGRLARGTYSIPSVSHLEK